MDGPDENGVQRRLFENGVDNGSRKSSNSLTPPPADVPDGVTRRHKQTESSRGRLVVSVLVIFALVAALVGTYAVERMEASKVLKSVPAQLAIVSMLWGLTSCAFTWWYTYFDSHDPGTFPSSPLKLSASPIQNRSQVEGQWHFSYIMAPINGIVAMCLYLYWKLVWVAQHQDRLGL